MSDQRIDESAPHPGSLTWHTLALALIASFALFARFFRADTVGFFEDDFFYYAEVAKNLALHHLSSFDGVHLTNGYHPLWMVLLAALLLFTSGTGFLVAVQLITLAAILCFYLLLLNLLSSFEIPSHLRRSLALLLSLHALLLFRYGMEVTLSLPLGMAALAYFLHPGFRALPRQIAFLGLLIALAVLARLDTLVLFALLLAAHILTSRSPSRERLQHLALFTLGFSPFLLYLAINRHFFGTLFPISAAAKQLKPLFPPSLGPLVATFLPMDRMKAAFLLPAVVLLAAALTRLAQSWRGLAPHRRAILLALMLFPLLHIALLCLLSDWGTWPWYLYPLVYSSFAALVVLVSPAPAPDLNAAFSPTYLRATIAIATLFYATYLCVYSVKKQPSPIALISRDLAVYMRAHPANYAMGDEAGTTRYLSAQPILQLEGLMEDRDFLEHIRERRRLASVLTDYHVRFYIVLYAQQHDGCYLVNEPTNAGAASPHMPGRICHAPLFTSTHAGSTASLFNANAVQ